MATRPVRFGFPFCASLFLAGCPGDDVPVGGDTETDGTTTGSGSSTISASASNSASATMTTASSTSPTGTDTTDTDTTDTETTDATDTTTTGGEDSTTTGGEDSTTTGGEDSTTTGGGDSTTTTGGGDSTTTTGGEDSTTTGGEDSTTTGGESTATGAFVCDETLSNYSSSPAAAIMDMSVTSDTITAAGEIGVIESMTVTIDVTHTFASDLDITLTSPSGTVIVLTTDSGGSNDDVFAGTTFSDDADDPVGDHEGYADGVTATPLTPEGAMAQVHGEDPNGTWTLDVGDDGNLDTGMFNSWSLDLRILDPALTAFGPDSFNASPAAAIDDLTSFSGDLDVDTVGSICRIDVFTGIDHTFPGDLDIFLTSPSGTTTTLTTDNGVGNDDVYSDTQWTDTAALPATDFPYVDMMAASPVVPEGAFAIFNGEDPNGTWTLDVIDDAAVDSGMVNTWGIDVYVCECLPET